MEEFRLQLALFYRKKVNTENNNVANYKIIIIIKDT